MMGSEPFLCGESRARKLEKKEGESVEGEVVVGGFIIVSKI